MKEFKKRLLAFMMSIAIVCSLFPTYIFAASEETVTITTESLSSGVAFRDYTPQTLQATGNVVNWNITKGSLPNNLQLDFRTGVISGLPTETGEYTFTVTAKNQRGQSDSKEFTIRIISASDEVIIATESLEDGFVSKSYSQTLECQNSQDTTFSITEGDLPKGLLLDTNTGVISGVPTQAGEYTFTVTAKNNQSGATDSKEFKIIIRNPGEIHITTESLKDGVVLRSYNKTLEAESDGTITWDITKGSLPKGLSLDTNTGVISGAPTKAGEYTFTVTATNESGDKDSKEFTINVYYAFARVSGSVKDSNGNPIEGATVTRLDKDGTLLATKQTDKDGKYTFSGNFLYEKYQIKASLDGYYDNTIDITLHGQDILDADITLNKKSVHITTESLKDGVVLRSYNKTLEAEGDGTITWDITKGSLPKGLSLDTNTGVISGAPTKAGEYTFTVTAKNESGDKDSKEFTINVDYAFARVSGVVKDSNGNPIEGAIVTLSDSDGNTFGSIQTDEKGSYIISSNFHYGNYQIKASFDGYYDNTIDVTLHGQDILDANITLTSNLSNTYEITDGAGSIWQKGSLEGLRFVCNGEYDKFTEIMIDGQIISTNYYTSQKGSTIITLNTSYLETLSLGEHKLTINYLDGFAETNFTIQVASVNPSEPSQNENDSNSQDSTNTQNETSQNENNSSMQPTDTPQTGDNSFIGFLIGLIGLSMAWAITNKFIGRKRSSK